MTEGPERRGKTGGRLAPIIELSDAERAALEGIQRQRSAPQQLVQRASIILACADGLSNLEIAAALGLSLDMIGLWRSRWKQQSEVALEQSEASLEERTVAERLSVVQRLMDGPRSGAPPRISAEQYCKIMAVACESPEDSGRPITHWTTSELAQEVMQRGIVETISPRQVGRFFKRCGSEAPSHPLLARSRTRRTP